MAKKPFKYFVSYAHDDFQVAERFLNKLHIQMRPSAHYEYEPWRDQRILLGQDWDTTIKQALNESHGGLLVLSPAFLGSPYIHQTELPALRNNPDKIVLPVLLETIQFDLHDLKGLEASQIFSLPETWPPKAYAMCDRFERRLFVEQLFVAIEKRLDGDLK